MKKRYRKPGVIIVSLLIVCSSVFFLSSSTDDFKLVKNLEIYYSLFRELNLFYVDDTDPEKLVKESIEGMLKSLDPYTTFIPESQGDNFRFMTTGEYGGIGSLIRRSGEYTIIAEPYEGFPAAMNGLKAGDTIVSIDGTVMKNKGIADISEKLKGKPNTKVDLVIRRYGVPEDIKLSINREKITINNVPFYGLLEEGVGYIRLGNFTTGASSEVKKALIDLKNNHAISSLILDLRDNPGGLLIEAVNVAGLFVDKGQEVVSTKGKVKQWDYKYKTRNAPVDTEIPLAILVSRSSASASEIVAGAIQDLDRGVIIGQRTYGKGLVQTTRDLSYNTKLKVTTAKYYIPSGRCIQALDYSNRNEDGSVGTIPDSLISEYKTKNGRTVTDGGGILPDFKLDRRTFSSTTGSLVTQSVIFKYATVFSSAHESIPAVSDFIIDEEIYEDFKQYVESQDFNYTTRSEESLKELIETAKREKYYSLAEDQFDALEEMLAHDNQKDLENFKEEIKYFLKQELSGRYYYQKGKNQAAIEHLAELEKAIEVLNDPELYASTLTVRSPESRTASSVVR